MDYDNEGWFWRASNDEVKAVLVDVPLVYGWSGHDYVHEPESNTPPLRPDPARNLLTIDAKVMDGALA